MDECANKEGSNNANSFVLETFNPIIEPELEEEDPGMEILNRCWRNSECFSLSARVRAM